MKITILNGNPNGRNRLFDQFLAKLTIFLEKQEHSVTNLKLRGMDIRYCTGCWGCWVKTPGECIFKDDSATVCEESINSDLLIFASPMLMGFTSAVLKKTMDRMIPLVHPYIEFDQKESHHRKRYDNYPALALLLDKTADPLTDDEDIAITTDIFKRVSLNFKSDLKFVTYTDSPIREVIDEINNI
ncbi:MAG: flavodoxin family protein [bacterium]|nr:flavodoxin family protein [bacterium]